MKARSAAVVSMAAAAVLAVGGCGSASTPGGSTTTVPAAAQQPAGSANGLCFDANSDLARSAMARLSPPPVGEWQVGQVSDEKISSGCDGVLSYMEVYSNVNHPYTHLLFFTGGKYLGTATSDPYMYTRITGTSRTSLSLTYAWLEGDNDPMCCPKGGPSTVTFTLNGTKVTANGTFPPHS
ncbi:hypothetical protein GPX89_01825 [Nocardia sp. ET3-3]|uniref:LppP/LprE family lipoprotein n=1 Tax=Nocardia terrae TaxID=2675851 RepID=A0A7K1UP82_9NOCA|nr:LppP/LprE family lipoprotein [Nocardia terrae]MVU75979.1 hypothetical protein [Nocardia terrae]